MKASSTSIRPWILSSAARASRIPLITPDWTHCWNRRWQVVWYDGYRSGSSTQGAPVRKTHKMPFRTARRSFQGRPRPSRRLAGSGTRGSRIFHCWSVRSRLWHIPVPRHDLVVQLAKAEFVPIGCKAQQSAASRSQRPIPPPHERPQSQPAVSLVTARQLTCPVCALIRTWSLQPSRSCVSLFVGSENGSHGSAKVQEGKPGCNPRRFQDFLFNLGLRLRSHHADRLRADRDSR
jgi:hypothetical protein